MKARCVFDDSSELSDDQRGRFGDRKFPVTVGKEYTIAGFGIWEGIFDVLIRCDWGLPHWFPAGLFDIPEQPIPTGWRFHVDDGLRLSGRELWTHRVMMCGYEELGRDTSHSDALMEREPEALALFEERLAQITAEDEARETA